MLGKRKRSATSSRPSKKGRHLTKTEKTDVKKIVERKVAKSTLHNGPVPIPPITGVLASAPTALVAFSNTDAGLREYQRRGDQIYIDMIKFRCFVESTALNEVLRLTVLRQPRSGFPPQPINLSAVWQNYGTGTGGITSGFQDDQPCSILFDKRYVFGQSMSPNGRYIEFTLNFSKRPLKVVYQDGSSNGTPFNTVLGEIELVAATKSAGLCTMTYTYDVVFHEK